MWKFVSQFAVPLLSCLRRLALAALAAAEPPHCRAQIPILFQRNCHNALKQAKNKEKNLWYDFTFHVFCSLMKIYHSKYWCLLLVKYFFLSKRKRNWDSVAIISQGNITGLMFSWQFCYFLVWKHCIYHILYGWWFRYCRDLMVNWYRCKLFMPDCLSRKKTPKCT